MRVRSSSCRLCIQEMVECFVGGLVRSQVPLDNICQRPPTSGHAISAGAKEEEELHMRRLLIVLVVATTFVTLGAGSALADGPLATTDGSSAQFITSNNSFNNCDSDADGYWVYVSGHLQG